MANHWEVISNRQQIISNTPQDLWLQAIEYFKWCDSNPLNQKRALVNGKGAGTHVTEEMTRPYTIKGLCLHCGITEEYLKDIRNTKDDASEYWHVVSKILYIVYVQNQEYATVGVFNPMFTAKLLNLDSGEADIPRGVKVIVEQGLPKLSNSEEEVLNSLELEYAYVDNKTSE